MSKQITLDYQEFLDMQTELDRLRKPVDHFTLTEDEQQQAVGVLMVRCLQNPNLFRQATDPVDLGKFKAIFTQAFYKDESGIPRLLIKFERT